MSCILYIMCPFGIAFRRRKSAFWKRRASFCVWKVLSSAIFFSNKRFLAMELRAPFSNSDSGHSYSPWELYPLSLNYPYLFLEIFILPYEIITEKPWRKLTAPSHLSLVNGDPQQKSLQRSHAENPQQTHCSTSPNEPTNHTVDNPIPSTQQPTWACWPKTEKS